MSDQDLETILESGRLSPSSIGIEAWKFIVVNNKEIRTQLREAGYDQSKITDSSHLIILSRRTDAEVISGEAVYASFPKSRRSMSEVLEVIN